MNKLFFHPLRAGLIAAGLAAMMAAPVSAGPMPQPSAVAPSSDIIQARAEWAGDGKSPRQERWIRRNGNGNWRNHDWRRNRHGHHDSRRYRHHRRHGGSGVYFGLGLLPSYNYVAPRRHYRSGSSAHVNWCHDRYRSYRAWDNSWQPYNGPRRQCRSPYR